MMRQNLALVLVLAFASTPAFAKRLQEMKTTKDKWDDLMSDQQLEDDKPKREIIRPSQTEALPRTPTARAPASRTATSRGPASAVTQQRAGTPVNTRAPNSVPAMQATVAPPIFPVAAITFDQYVQDNARNPALSTRIADHQMAFTETTGPAIISIPGSESEKAATAAAAAPGSAANAGAAGSNTAAIQAAAAAAAAAGLIPPGTTLPGGAGASSTSAPGPVR